MHPSLTLFLVAFHHSLTSCLLLISLFLCPPSYGCFMRACVPVGSGYFLTEFTSFGSLSISGSVSFACLSEQVCRRSSESEPSYVASFVPSNVPSLVPWARAKHVSWTPVEPPVWYYQNTGSRSSKCVSGFVLQKPVSFGSSGSYVYEPLWKRKRYNHMYESYINGLCCISHMTFLFLHLKYHIPAKDPSDAPPPYQALTPICVLGLGVNKGRQPHRNIWTSPRHQPALTSRSPEFKNGTKIYFHFTSFWKTYCGESRNSQLE